MLIINLKLVPNLKSIPEYWDINLYLLKSTVASLKNFSGVFGVDSLLFQHP